MKETINSIINKLILIRHEKRYESPVFNTSITHQGIIDSKQILSRVNSIKNKGGPMVIFTSPYLRCLQTALPIKNLDSNVNINVDNCLSEWFLPCDRQHQLVFRNLTQSERDTYNVNNCYQSLLDVSEIPSNESKSQLQNRVKLFLRHLVDYCNTNPEIQRLVLITHLSLIETLLEVTSKETDLSFRHSDKIDMGTITYSTPSQKWVTIHNR